MVQSAESGSTTLTLCFARKRLSGISTCDLGGLASVEGARGAKRFAWQGALRAGVLGQRGCLESPFRVLTA